MNDNHPQQPDDFEEELRSVRPRALSDGFVEALGERLEASDVHRNPSHFSRVNVVKIVSSLAAVVALLLIAFWLLRTPRERDDLPNGNEFVGPKTAPLDEPSDLNSQPSLLAYSQATHDDRRLEELLDYHARVLLPRSGDADAASLFPR